MLFSLGLAAEVRPPEERNLYPPQASSTPIDLMHTVSPPSPPLLLALDLSELIHRYLGRDTLELAQLTRLNAFLLC